MTSPAPVRYGRPDGRWVLLATVAASGAALLDSTVVTVALPTIGRQLHSSYAALQWVVNGYALTLAALILLGGSLGDRFGRRRVFVIGTVWFAVASLGCAVAPSAASLVGFRLLQGIGGALLTPGSLALISASFVESDRGRAIGAWSGLGGVAAAIGPLLGGILVGLSWRYVFLINLPLCALVVWVAVRHVPESRDEHAARRLDVSGTLLGSAALALISYALSGAGSPLLASALGVAGMAAAAGFIAVERGSRAPLLDLALFRIRQFSAVNLVTFAVYAALSGVFFLLPQQLQIVSGYSPLAAGAAALPVTLCMLVLSARSGALAARIGPRLQMTAGPALCAVGALLMLGIGRHASYPTRVLPAVLAFALGLSATVAPLTSAVLSAVADRHAGIASGVNNAVARTAGLFAVAILPLIAGLTGRGYAARFASGFPIAMVVCAGLLAAGAVLSATLVSNAQPAPNPAPITGA